MNNGRVNARNGGPAVAGLLLSLAAVATLATASLPAARVAGHPVAAAPVATGAATPAPGRTGQPTPQTTGADGAGDVYYPTDGNGGYDVDGYHVSISYQPTDRQLDGDTTVTARATQPLSRFNLDLYRLTVHSVEVNDQPAQFTQQGEHELVITPAAAIDGGATFRTRVRYSGTPGLFRESGLGAGGWYANSSGAAIAAGEPHSATAWYPANDTPRDKATFAVDVRVPDGWTAVSNGIDEPSTSDGGWTTFRWRHAQPVATYLTTVAIDRWRLVRSRLPDGTPVIDAYAPRINSNGVPEQRLPEVLAFLAQRFGPYPFEAAGGIFIGTSIGYALETQTRSIYSSTGDVGLIVHENAHQWFGNSVSLSNWADICLNECFASYAQWLWAEAKEGADLDQRYREAVRGIDFDRRLYDMGAGNEFRGVYSKGPAAVHALRRQLGEQAFDRLLKGWTARHRGGNASWPQFEDYAAEVSGQQLDGFFQAWFRDSRRPAEQYLWPGSLHP